MQNNLNGLAAYAFVTVLFSISICHAQYAIEPILEKDNVLIESMDTSLNIDIIAKDDTDACNQAIYMIGTQYTHPVKTYVCKKDGKKCDYRVFAETQIVGARIIKEQEDGSHRTVSSVNNIANGEAQYKLCENSLSWDPAKEENQVHARAEYYLRSGPRKHIYQGDLNPQRPKDPAGSVK